VTFAKNLGKIILKMCFIFEKKLCFFMVSTVTLSGFCEYGDELSDFLTKVIILMVAAFVF